MAKILYKTFSLSRQEALHTRLRACTRTIGSVGFHGPLEPGRPLEPGPTEEGPPAGLLYKLSDPMYYVLTVSTVDTHICIKQVSISNKPRLTFEPRDHQVGLSLRALGF